MTRRGNLVIAVLLGGVVALCLPNHGAAAATTSKSRPRVVVTPRAALRNGEHVTVRFSGFPSGQKVFVSECASARDATVTGCGLEPAAQPFGFTNARGQGSIGFVVRSHAAAGPITRTGKPRHQLCATCVLVVADGQNADHPHLDRFAVAGLSFGPATLPFTGLPIAILELTGVATLSIGLLVTAGSRRRPAEAVR